MKCPKLFIYTLLLSLILGTTQSVSAQQQAASQRCKNLTLTIQKTADATAHSGASVEARVSGAEGKVRYFLTNKAGELLNEGDYLTSSFTNLKRDTYTLAVVDSNGCTTDKEFKIQ